MQKNKSLTFNFIMNTILTMSSLIFPLITFPYVSRILSPEGTGKVSFTVSVVSYFALFSQLGIPTYGIRACAKVRDNRKELSKTVQELFIINIVMCICTYIAFTIVLYSVPRFKEESQLFWIISTTIIFNSIGMEWLYKALEKYTYITIRSVIFKLIALVAMFAVVHDKNDYILYGALYIFAASASSVFNFINVHKFVDIRPMKNYNVRRHFKAIFIFFSMSCATVIYTNLDNVMLGLMKTNIDVGYYNAAVKVKSILVSLVTSLGTVLLPRTSYFIEYGLKDEFFQITRKAINFVLIIAPAMALYFMTFSKESILLLSGKEYYGAIMPMKIIMPTLVFIGLTNIMGTQMLVPLGKEKYVLYSEVTGALIDIILNMILIPKMAAVGAAIGTLVAEIIVCIVQYTFLRTQIELAYKNIKYIKIIMALSIGFLGSFWLKALNLNNLLTLVISAGLYFGLYVLTLLFLKEPLVEEMTNKFLCKVKSIL